MTIVMRLIGRTIYYLAWPFWIIYFRLYNQRCRVKLICGDEILLVKGTLGLSHWSLPGGGVKRGESLAVAAARELSEEVGILLDESKLKLVGSYMHRSKGFSYQAFIFEYELKEKPVLKKQPLEIVDAAWFKLDQLAELNIDDDVKFAMSA